MIEHRSPNHEPRRKAVDMLVLHYTGMRSAAAALDRLCDPGAKVSAHYLVDEAGEVWRLVAEDRRAWHAGAAFWAGERDVNGVSIGIELQNPGHEFGYPGFAEAQMAALETLAADIVRRRRIPKRRVLGHSDVAPRRKQDPGELFDWARLARRGVGLWPAPDGSPAAGPSFGPGDRAPEIAHAQRLLARFGYDIAETGVFGTDTEAVVTAFQRHFRPARLDGRLDAETRARLHALLASAEA